MTLLDITRHLLSFLAPALAVAAAVAWAARWRWLLPLDAKRPAWGASFALNLLAGLVVLTAGLWFFGRDGKMLTYALMGVAVATTQWLAGRAWRERQG